jgi:hypothetical protein
LFSAKDDGEKQAATYEEKQRELDKAEVLKQQERTSTIGYAAMHLALSLVAISSYSDHTGLAVTGDSLECRAATVLVLPLYTPFTISMWKVLMVVVDYVNWVQSRKLTPKQVVDEGAIPAELRPVDRNFVMDVVFYVSGVLLGIWACSAFVFAPALVGFFPVVLVLLLVCPLVLLMCPLWLASWLRKWASTKKEKKAKVMDLLVAEPKLLLKVGMMQTMTTMICMGWFGGVYYGSQSWLDAVQEVFRAVPSFAVGFPKLLVEWPNFFFKFSWWQIQWPSKYVLVASLAAIGMELWLKGFQAFSKWQGDRGGGQGENSSRTRGRCPS